MAPYGLFLLNAHKETKVAHIPGPQYNDPYHHIHNRMIHSYSRFCNRLQIPSESSLTISELTTNYSSGSTVPKMASQKYCSSRTGTSDFMKSGLSKFFAQMTNAFPPSTSWSRKRLFLNSCGNTHINSASPSCVQFSTFPHSSPLTNLWSTHQINLQLFLRVPSQLISLSLSNSSFCSALQDLSPFFITAILPLSAHPSTLLPS
jgi:hypothetical protein